jgi:hypothetical protein
MAGAATPAAVPAKALGAARLSHAVLWEAAGLGQCPREEGLVERAGDAWYAFQCSGC